MLLDVIRELSSFFMDMHMPLPCWDLIADAHGFCR